MSLRSFCRFAWSSHVLRSGQTRLMTYSSLFILAGALCYAYAIANVKLFSMASVLDPLRLFPLTSKIALIIAGAGLLGFIALGIPVARLSFGPRSPDEWERFVVLTVMSGLLPTLAMIALIVRAVSRPVRRLTEAAVEMTHGRYGTQVEEPRSNDEIGVLAEAFNAMSRRVASDVSVGTCMWSLCQCEIHRWVAVAARAIASGFSYARPQPPANAVPESQGSQIKRTPLVECG